MRVLWWMVALGIAGAAFACWASPKPRPETFDWFAVNLGMWAGWLSLLVVPHELAHALTAKAVGYRVWWVQFGSGRPLIEWNLGGTRYSIRMVPLGGASQDLPGEGAWSRWRTALVILAGPMAHVVLAAAALALSPLSLRQILPNSLHFTEPQAEVTFVYANAWLFLTTLLTRRRPGAGWPSDGQQFFRLLYQPGPAPGQLAYAEMLFEIWEVHRAGRLEEATAMVQAGLHDKPDDRWLQIRLAGMQVGVGQIAPARAALVQMLNCEWPERQVHEPYIKNGIAWADTLLTNGDDDLLKEADAYSAEALSHDPTDTGFQGTRGTVFVLKGRLQEGFRLLKNAYNYGDARSSRAGDAAWIAIAFIRKGNMRNAGRWLARACKEWPRSPSVALAEKEFAAAKARGGG